MPTTIGGRQVATDKSPHMTVTPPVISNIPPMAPPTPVGVPAPFPYMGRTQTAKQTSTKLKVAGGKAVLKDCPFDVDPPGNMPSQPAPIHDIVTMLVKKKFHV